MATRLSAKTAAAKTAKKQASIQLEIKQEKAIERQWGAQRFKLICAASEGNESTIFKAKLIRPSELVGLGFRCLHIDCARFQSELQEKKDELEVARKKSLAPIESSLNSRIDLFVSSQKRVLNEYFQSIDSARKALLEAIENYLEHPNEPLYFHLNNDGEVCYFDDAHFLYELLEIQRIVDRHRKATNATSFSEQEFAKSFPDDYSVELRLPCKEVILAGDLENYFSINWGDDSWSDWRESQVFSAVLLKWLSGASGQKFLKRFESIVKASIRHAKSSLELFVFQTASGFELGLASGARTASPRCDQLIAILKALGYSSRVKAIDETTTAMIVSWK